jgi:hypothetical protein
MPSGQHARRALRPRAREQGRDGRLLCARWPGAKVGRLRATSDLRGGLRRCVLGGRAARGSAVRPWPGAEALVGCMPTGEMRGMLCCRAPKAGPRGRRPAPAGPAPRCEVSSAAPESRTATSFGQAQSSASKAGAPWSASLGAESTKQGLPGDPGAEPPRPAPAGPEARGWSADRGSLLARPPTPGVDRPPAPSYQPHVQQHGLGWRLHVVSMEWGVPWPARDSSW